MYKKLFLAPFIDSDPLDPLLNPKTMQDIFVSNIERHLSINKGYMDKSVKIYF
jgi:hypothetical protein